MMDVNAYLARIRYDGGIEPTLGNLKALMRAQLMAVPFENLDIYRNIPIYMDPEAQFEKIVKRKRGGFCYELNSLFYRLLDKLGYETEMASARSYNWEKNTFGPEYDHMVVLVLVNRLLYLVDVGWGECPLGPLELDFDVNLEDENGQYRMKLGELDDIILCKVQNYSAKPLYIFTQTPRRLKEFEQMCKYHQTSPHSRFKRERMAMMPTINGKKSLVGNTFTLVYGKGEIEVEIETEEEIKQLLKKEFGIDLQYS